MQIPPSPLNTHTYAPTKYNVMFEVITLKNDETMYQRERTVFFSFFRFIYGTSNVKKMPSSPDTSYDIR